MYANKIQVISAGANRVVLKRGVHEFLFSGSGSLETAEQLVQLLDGTKQREEIVSFFPGDVRPQIDRLLTGLKRRGLAFDSPEAARDAGGEETPFGSFYRNFFPTSKRSEELVRTATVMVVGVNLITRSLVTGLLESGLGRVQLVKHPILDNLNCREVETWRGELENHDKVELWSNLPAVELQRQRDISLICSASDFGEANALLDLSRLSRKVDRPYLPVWMSDLIGHLGPLSYPHETACLRCYRLRRDSNDEHLDVRRAVRDFVAEEGSARESAGLLPPMAAAVGNIAAMEVIKAIAGFMPSNAIGRHIEINLLSFESRIRRVLKIPRCPDCSETARIAPMTLSVGPQIPNKT